MDDDDLIERCMACVMGLLGSGLVLLTISMAYAFAWEYLGIIGVAVVTAWWTTVVWFTLGTKLRDAYRAHFEPPDPDDVAQPVPWERHR